jgi:hypothetical protein
VNGRTAPSLLSLEHFDLLAKGEVFEDQVLAALEGRRESRNQGLQ